MLGLRQQVEETISVIRQSWPHRPRIGLICGSGLSELVRPIDVAASIAFSDLPHFVPTTALGHMGQLVCGKWHGMNLIAMQGRLHFYEGYSLAEVTYPIRVFKQLGVDILIVTSASGGMNPHYQAGQIVVVDDHINMMGDNPLVGPNDDFWGPRYPDMSQPYDKELIKQALEVGQRLGLSPQKGVYLGVKGPNYETRAEYRFFRSTGADVVGMSTVPETLVAVHCGMRVLGLSTVTNVCLPDALTPTSGAEVLDVAQKASRGVSSLIDELIRLQSKNYREELFQE